MKNPRFYVQGLNKNLVLSLGYSRNFEPGLGIRSILVRKMSDSLTSLIWFERTERFTHITHQKRGNERNWAICSKSLIWFERNERMSKWANSKACIIVRAGLGTAFFSFLNVSSFCVLLKNTTFFYIHFSSFWRLKRPKRMMRSFAFFS